MGLFTAYHATERFERIVVLERGRIGDPTTASFGRTRSFRNDYLDGTYAQLAHEAFDLWDEFERRTATAVLVRCGCLNIASGSVTPDLARTYAERSHRILQEVGLRTQELDRGELRARFPFLDADLGRVDLDAGVVDAIGEGRRPPAMDPAAAAVWDLLDELHRTRQVGDDTWARALAELGDAAVVEVVGTAGYYTTLAMVMNVARTPVPEGADPLPDARAQDGAAR